MVRQGLTCSCCGCTCHPSTLPPFRPSRCPQFVRDVGDGILPSWAPIVERRRGQPFSEEQRQWQLVRRGRYLEFNLLYDRGVKFGLDAGRWVGCRVGSGVDVGRSGGGW